MKQLCCICYNIDMKYNVSNDIKVVCKILDFSYSKLAAELNVARSTIARIANNEVYPSEIFLETFYSYVYENSRHPISLNKFKMDYAKEVYKDNVLFHGAKVSIEGDIDLDHSRKDIDVGIGFYLGESYEQASSYIFANKRSSIYLFETQKLNNLKLKEIDVSLEWMLMVSFYRGQLGKYKDSKVLKNLIDEIEKYDVIIAPIADNNMYDIMTRFASGDITDEQAIHALSASHLGKQHVLKTIKACKSVKMIDRLYLSKKERMDIEKGRKEAADISLDSANKAIESYRRIGNYIEEILK